MTSTSSNPPLTPARLAYAADGTPYSAEYDDVYHSSDGGLGQARHVFLAGNSLLGEHARWRGRERFVIVETGFGLGLNFLTTWQAWRDDPQRCERLHFVSLEKHPFQRADLAALHARWTELAACAADLQAKWPMLLPGAHRLNFDNERIVLTLFFGDAIDLLPKLRAKADAFYLDGFSPDKNPQLWSPRIYSNLARLATTGSTLATWTVAGKVRKELSAAGFLLEKAPGFSGKREMTRGVFRVVRTESSPLAQRSAIIVGAGLAGCATAERLASRGWQIILIDSADGLAQGASGNHAGILRPLPSIDDNLLARLTRAGFLHARRHMQLLETEGLSPGWDACGVLHLAREAQHEATQRQIVDALQPPPEYLRCVDRSEASRLASWPVRNGGWWFPGGGWINPPSLCHANIARFDKRIRRLFGCEVARIAHIDGEWQTFDTAGEVIASSPVLILANAGDARRLLKNDVNIDLPLRNARGQVTHLPAEVLSAPDIVVCRLGYVIPEVNGFRCAGASFIADDAGDELRLDEHRDNLARLEFALPGSTVNIAAESLEGRVGFRSMTLDRLPLIGPLPVNQPAIHLDDISRKPGLYGILGFGARGLVWASLAAELLAAQIEGEPLPLEADLVAAVDPARFMLRRARRASQPRDLLD